MDKDKCLFEVDEVLGISVSLPVAHRIDVNLPSAFATFRKLHTFKGGKKEKMMS